MRPLELVGAQVLLALSAALLAGCGSTVVGGDPGGGQGGEGGWAVGPGSGAGGPGGGPVDGGKDALSDYSDPGCPDAGPPKSFFSCDPYNQNNGDCGPGEGCYIFVQYPTSNEPCDQESYGSVCAPAGSGGQGDPCQGGQSCQGGFVCVITGAGTQCVKLCPLVGDHQCASGLVCEPIDVEGFGGCL